MPEFRDAAHNNVTKTRGETQEVACQKDDKVVRDRNALGHDPAPLRPQRGRTEKKEIVDAYDLLSLFKMQHLDASGDAFYKAGLIQRPKKHYVELRGSTMVMFRNSSIATSQGIQMRDIIAVIVLKHYQVEIEKRQGQSPRIYIRGPGLDSTQCLYIKVANDRDLDVWSKALVIAESVAIPALQSMSVESIIGQGGGGKVFLVHHKELNESYALKVIDKRHTFSSATAFKHVISERSLMHVIGSHPFVLPMRFAFQSDKNLFIGTQFCRGGDLATYLKNQRKKYGARSPESTEALLAGNQGEAVERKCRRYGGHLPEDRARSVLAEIILALEHLHARGIVYRDLKPENVLIADDGHLRLADFGLSKHLSPARSKKNGFERTSSICGTRNYLPPEMLLGKPYGCEADMWSLGIMTFRILCGRFPFEAQRTREMFHKVKRESVRIPSYISSVGASFIEGLLCRDQAKRLTAAGAKTHDFFRDVQWIDVLMKRCCPPIEDIHLGRSAMDALENFELSKLYGISLGECVSTEGDSSQLETDPQWRLDPAGRIVGFEYAEAEGNANELLTLAVRKVPGILSTLRKLPSSGSDSNNFVRRKSDLGDFVRAALSSRSQSGSRSSRDGMEQSPRSPSAAPFD